MTSSPEPRLNARGVPLKHPEQQRFGNANARRTHGRYAAKAEGRRNLQAGVRKLYASWPHLRDVPEELLYAFVRVSRLLDRMGAEAEKAGPLTPSGEPTKLCEAIRRCTAELRAMASALGLTSADGGTGPPSMAEQIARMRGAP